MSFKDIKGQEKPIQILKEYIRHSRLAESYLFIGPEGVGKKLVAKTLAKTLNCEEEILDSCDRCASCLKIEKGQHPDVHIIDSSTKVYIDAQGIKPDNGDSEAIGINHIRQLQQDISLRAYEGKIKVFIIDDAHNLTAAASNALLKILEEPPKDSLIILITAKPTLLFKTILSRCQILKFYPLTRPALEDILKKDYSLDSSLAHFLAYFCEGRFGLALALKDTQIFQEKNRVIDEFAFSRQTSIDTLPIRNRQDIRFYLNILASWFRDIYLIKTGVAHFELINLDRKKDLLRLMQRFSFADLDEILAILSNSSFYLEHNINTKLLLSNLKVGLWKE